MTDASKTPADAVREIGEARNKATGYDLANVKGFIFAEYEAHDENAETVARFYGDENQDGDDANAQFYVIAHNLFPQVERYVRELEKQIADLTQSDGRLNRCQDCGCGVERHTSLPAPVCLDCECLEYIGAKL